MENNKLKYFKNKLLNEKKRVNELLLQMEKNETINSNSEMSSELSFYDNHTGDSAGNLYDKEMGMAFKEHEVTIIKKIDEALNNIDNGSYGQCKMCRKDIPIERLEFLPYAEYCIECQKALNFKPSEIHNRPIEESALGIPFGYGYNDNSYNDEVEFDAEDSYQSVEVFNKLPHIEEYYEDQDDDGYVEPIEKISNEQYKNQLPD